MQQIKIFKGIETEVSVLEAEVNSWLAESKVRVISMSGNIAPQTQASKETAGLSKSRFAPSDVLLIILYEQP